MTDRFTPVADARAHILAACTPVAGTQRVPLRDALGRYGYDTSAVKYWFQKEMAVFVQYGVTLRVS